MISSPTCFSVTQDYLCTPRGAKCFGVKSYKVTEKWMEYFYGKTSSASLKTRKTIVKRTGTILDWYLINSKVQSLFRAWKAFSPRDTWFSTCRKTVYATELTTSLGKLLSTSLIICHYDGILSLSKQVLVALEVVGTTAAVLFIIKSLFDIQGILERIPTYQFTDPGLSLMKMKLIHKFTCVGEGLLILGLLSTGGYASVMPVLATAAFTLSIAKYYFEKIYINNKSFII